MGFTHLPSPINLIISLSPLSCSLSSFYLCWGFVEATIAFPQHNPLKKKRLGHRGVTITAPRDSHIELQRASDSHVLKENEV